MTGQIEIEHLDDIHYRVTVNGVTQTTHHHVAVRPEYKQQLVGDAVSGRQLLEASFKFLMEREPNSSILLGFDLAEIERYYPNYPEEIKNRV